MAVVYISSTYEDLKDHREAIYRALRRLGHDVRAMEDYVATDQRPIDKCIADVSACDVYVGILAWRYGFVPTDHNPDGLSITELEYRKAKELGKPLLIFMANEKAPWPPEFIDTGKDAERVRALRGELNARTVRSLFASPDELASLVTTAVTLKVGYDPANTQTRLERDFLPLSELIEGSFSAVEKSEDSGNKLVTGVPSGFVELDSLTLGSSRGLPASRASASRVRNSAPCGRAKL